MTRNHFVCFAYTIFAAKNDDFVVTDEMRCVLGGFTSFAGDEDFDIV